MPLNDAEKYLHEAERRAQIHDEPGAETYALISIAHSLTDMLRQQREANIDRMIGAL